MAHIRTGKWKFMFVGEPYAPWKMRENPLAADSVWLLSIWHAVCPNRCSSIMMVHERHAVTRNDTETVPFGWRRRETHHRIHQEVAVSPCARASDIAPTLCVLYPHQPPDHVSSDDWFSPSPSYQSRTSVITVTPFIPFARRSMSITTSTSSIARYCG